MMIEQRDCLVALARHNAYCYHSAHSVITVGTPLVLHGLQGQFGWQIDVDIWMHQTFTPDDDSVKHGASRTETAEQKPKGRG